MELAISPERITIRPLTEDDFGALFEERVRHLADTWFDRQKRGEVYLATVEIDGEPIARAGLDYAHQSDCAWLWAIYVRSEWRSKGIGSYLMTHIEDVTRQHGYDQLFLGVAKDNPRAQELYEHLGFATYSAGISTWSFPQDGQMVRESEEVWLMVKNLDENI